MRHLHKEYGTGRTGQSRRLFRQVFLPDPVTADAETVASLDDLPGELVQIFPAEVGVAEVAVEIGHREHHPVTVLRAVGQIVGHQSGQDIGGHFLRAYLLKLFCHRRRGPSSRASAIISSKRIVHAPSVRVDRLSVWY